MMLGVSVLERCLLLQIKLREPLQNHLVQRAYQHQALVPALAPRHSALAPLAIVLHRIIALAPVLQHLIALALALHRLIVLALVLLHQLITLVVPAVVQHLIALALLPPLLTRPVHRLIALAPIAPVVLQRLIAPVVVHLLKVHDHM